MQLDLINCNCIINIKNIYIESDKGKRKVEKYKNNADFTKNHFYYLKNLPQIEFDLEDNDKKIIVEIEFLKYDFDDPIFQELLDIVKEKEQKLKECVDTYEKVIAQKDSEFKESVDTYEKVIAQKDCEFKKSVDAYEKVINSKNLIGKIWKK